SALSHGRSQIPAMLKQRDNLVAFGHVNKRLGGAHPLQGSTHTRARQSYEGQAMKIGILTGGGDCPGLNAVIRAVVRKGTFHYSDGFVGFMEGWRGVLENTTMPLDLTSVSGILPRGGTILRTSRTNPAKKPDGIEKCLATLKQNNLDALIAMGGDDT